MREGGEVKTILVIAGRREKGIHHKLAGAAALPSGRSHWGRESSGHR